MVSTARHPPLGHSGETYHMVRQERVWAPESDQSFTVGSADYVTSDKLFNLFEHTVPSMEWGYNKIATTNA